jgi:hypothetical protein
VVIVGELAIPFISARNNISFSKYKDTNSAMRIMCLNVLSKALMRGVKVFLPIDIVIGNEMVSDSLRSKAYENVDLCDEGADYDDDISVVNLADPGLKSV